MHTNRVAVELLLDTMGQFHHSMHAVNLGMGNLEWRSGRNW